MSAERGRMYLEHDEHFAQSEKLMFAKERMEVLPDHKFYTLIVNSANAVIYTLENMGRAQSNDLLSTTNDPEVPCQQSFVDSQPELCTVHTVSTALVTNLLKRRTMMRQSVVSFKTIKATRNIGNTWKFSLKCWKHSKLGGVCMLDP